MADERSVSDGVEAVKEVEQGEAGMTQTEVKQDRSMARLAEILEGAGIEVLWYNETECCRPPRLSFCGGDSENPRVRNLTISLGYPLVRYHTTYEIDESLPVMYRTMEFSIT